MGTRDFHFLDDIENLDWSRPVAYDTETTGLNFELGDRPFAFSFCDADFNTAYVEFPVNPIDRSVQYDMMPNELAVLEHYFYCSDAEWVCWNGKFDFLMTWAALKMKPQGKYHDVSVAAHCCKSNEPNFMLKKWAEKYCNIPADDEEWLANVIKKLRPRAKKKGWKINQKGPTTGKKGEDKLWAPDMWLAQYLKVLFPEGHDLWLKKVRKAMLCCREYAIRDAERTMFLHQVLDEMMGAYSVRHVYEKEMRLMEQLIDQEYRGVPLAYKNMRKVRAEYTEQLADWEAKVQEMAKPAIKAKKLTKAAHDSGYFNLKSPQQLAAMLYDYLKLKIPEHVFRRKKKGKDVSPRSTAAETLIEMRDMHPLVDIVLRIRSLNKGLEQIESYDAYKVKTKVTGRVHYRVHPTANQKGARTGRFSMSSPNLLQVSSANTGRGIHPIDTRGCFGPEDLKGDWIWISGDYSQQEIRIAAHESGDSNMLGIIRSGDDVHDACTNLVWGGTGPAALRVARLALGLDLEGSHGDTAVQKKARKRYGAVGRYDPDKVCKRFMEEFNGDIVKAEASLKKKNTRNKAKMVAFNEMYGGGDTALMTLARISKEEAKTTRIEWASQFPEFKTWAKQELEGLARKQGYVTNAYGRRLPVDPGKYYTCVNYMIQGGAADMLKEAYLRCQDYFYSLSRDPYKRPAVMLPIHDELLMAFPVPRPVRKLEDLLRPHNKKVMRVLGKVKELMEGAGYPFDVPMIAGLDLITDIWRNKTEIPEHYFAPF